MDPGPGQLVDAARVAVVRGLDQIGKGHSQRLGEAIQGGQADIVLPGLNGHKHASADAGLFCQSTLTELSDVAQATNVLADMLQHGGALAGIFVHYIAHQ
ncbi:hypothetical protein D3C79_757530 [compost metagenome]